MNQKRRKKNIIEVVFELLLAEYGKQNWWPGDSPFEVIIGAILTQNTSWKNVEKSISMLKDSNLLSPQAIYNTPLNKLARLIRSSGYYNQKAKKLKAFIKYFKGYDFDIENLKSIPLPRLRGELLDIYGIGFETADSILLYALDKPVFVVDAYTKRIFSRMGIINKEDKYEDIRLFFESSLKRDIYIYNEYHALIVKHGKDICKKSPLCSKCTLKRHKLCSFN